MLLYIYFFIWIFSLVYDPPVSTVSNLRFIITDWYIARTVKSPVVELYLFERINPTCARPPAHDIIDRPIRRRAQHRSGTV